MLGLGSIASAGLSIGGQLFGGNQSKKYMRKVENSLNQQQQDNQDWYNRNYYQDATQRTDAKAALTQMRETYENSIKQARGQAAVTGASEESVAAQKQAASAAMAQGYTSVAAAGDAKKDNIDAQYRATNANIEQQKRDLYTQQAQQAAQAGNALGNAASGLGASLLDMALGGQKQKQSTTAAG